MRRKWVAKAAAVCLSAAMTATPAVQSFAAEEATSAIQTEILEQDLQKEQDISVMAEAVESEAESAETVTEGSMPESESVPETEESAEETIAENV